MSDEVVLSCDNVSRTFVVGAGFMNRGRAFKAVDRVSLSIRRGETLAIVGESGSGKTTLARMLLGVLPPSEGTIAIGGKPIDGYDRLSLARVVQPISRTHIRRSIRARPSSRSSRRRSSFTVRPRPIGPRACAG